MPSLLARAALTAPCVLAFLSATSAHADQCAINDPAIADKAAELARKTTLLLDLCEPCGDKQGRGPYKIGTVESAHGRVSFDGTMRDLAYTYILVGKDTYQNLGLLAGCKAVRVSKEVTDARPPSTRPPGFVGSRPPVSIGPRPRVTSPGDLAGTWTVTVRPALSTCKATATNTTETWTITVDTSAGVTINLGTGADDFIGSQAPLQHGMYKLALSTKRRPSANVLQLSQSTKDNFWGRITRAESSGVKGDPACLIAADVTGKRAP